MRSAEEKRAAGNAACKRYYEKTCEDRKPTRAAYTKAHYAANREEILRRRRLYLEANLDAVREKRRLYVEANKERYAAQRAERKAKDPTRQARLSADYRKRNAQKVRDKYLAQYGITQHDYERLAAEQGHVCKICEREERVARSRLLCVDHDHETGKVRGLLCRNCNAALGGFQDNKDRLKKAVAYLEACDA